MKPKGKDLSLQARLALNRAVLDWLGKELDNISNQSLIAELFSPLKSGDLVLLRARLRNHLAGYRVFDKHVSRRCLIQHETTNLDDDAADWKPLSYPMIGAAMGQCHSTGIKAGKKASQE